MSRDTKTMPHLSIRRTHLVLLILISLLSLPTNGLVVQPPAPLESSSIREDSNEEPARAATGDRSRRRPNDADDLMLAAVRLIELGSSREATLRLEKLVLSHPYWLEPWLELAGLYSMEGRYDEAATALESALQADPSSRRAFESRLAVYRRLDAEGASGETSQGASRGRRSVPMEPANSTPSMMQASLDPADAMLTPMAETVSTELVKNVAAWAIAWSDQRAEDYLDFYSSRFTPEGGVGLETWKNQRRERVRRPSSVSVTVSFVTPKIVESGQAEVYFVQTYRSDSYHDIVRKTLVLAEENGQWKILEERVEG